MNSPGRGTALEIQRDEMITGSGFSRLPGGAALPGMASAAVGRF
jgi:hypothetical protein